MRADPDSVAMPQNYGGRDAPAVDEGAVAAAQIRNVKTGLHRTAAAWHDFEMPDRQ